MASIKEAVLETIKKLPDECTVDEIMYEIHLISQVFEGLKDAQSGKLISTEELLQRVKAWDK
jgi:hypothetical protein